ncbi:MULTISPECIES: formate dehydrogenase accessory sulfurtransferase FdhD [unclassified Thioalkalivibrio]|uniref:formate dehydrogenase accessory sulfurtransferase FdhD n=1 Tax=unclassified Thioalkalivibrio TaxID=2621013 RepID=UPI00037462B2|nr:MULTISPECIES: formate dehydrogenase accessory sulfurtransferase FdhD [unclassified Thioalkalivibrio]
MAVTPILRQRGANRIAIDEVLAVEMPLEIRLGYTHPQHGRQCKSLYVTMRTPGHDLELATGFLFGEGIITTATDIESVDTRWNNIVTIELKENISVSLERLERNFYTSSSCGLCGKATLKAVGLQGAKAVVGDDFSPSPSTLCRLGNSLREHQLLFRQTGGNHATAAFNSQGEILLVREDIGRHNAMDKLIGRLLLDSRVPLQDIGFLVSGRTSFELMQKTLMAGCPLLAGVGAPSSLAVDLAQEYNVTLVGFLREDGFNIFHGANRIQ